MSIILLPSAERGPSAFIARRCRRVITESVIAFLAKVSGVLIVVPMPYSVSRSLELQ
jgi:hypothetical protein